MQHDPGTGSIRNFCTSPDDNEAYQPHNDFTAVLFSNAEQLAAPGEVPEDLATPIDTLASFEVVPIDVDPAVFGNADNKLRGEIFSSPARVLGPPLWLQDDEGDDAGFLLQFDESFVPMNLGDSGVMYVYTDTAFWQCY